MIQMIDHTAVCGHLKATLSEIVDNDSLCKFIGKLNNLNPDLYEQYAKDLAYVFTQALQDRYDVDQEAIPHLRIRNVVMRTNCFGQTIRRNVYGDKVVNAILDMPNSDRRDSIMVALTNLKSACVIKTLSRAEKDDAYSSIAHTTYIDAEFVQEWHDFCRDFTPYLLDKLRISDNIVDHHDPLWMMSTAATSSAYVDDDGILHKTNKGNYNLLKSSNLRHPVVNRIARRHPDQFVSCVLTGFNVTGAKISLPDPFDHDIPVGRVALAPKRAQKMRVVFVPLGILDVMSRPLFHKLEQFYTWNIQGVKSHDKAREVVRELIANNDPQNEMWSFDQSSFTDNFSYAKIQRPILTELQSLGYISKYDLEVADALNYGAWDSSTLRPNSIVRFGTGTGMGTPPSFPLASIANGYIYAYSYSKVYGEYPNPTNPPQCQIVGDDAFIADYSVGRIYAETCNKMGLKINKSKSIVSNHTGEFCGKIITPNAVYDKHKLIDTPNYSSFVELAKYYGPDFPLYLQEEEDMLKLFDRFQDIPEPYGLREPIDPYNADIGSMDAYQLRALILAQASLCSNLVKRPIDRREWQELIRRKRMLPDFSYEMDISSISDTKQEPTLLVRLLAEEAQSYSDLCSSASFAELREAAERVNTIFTAIKPCITLRYPNETTGLSGVSDRKVKNPITSFLNYDLDTPITIDKEDEYEL